MASTNLPSHSQFLSQATRYHEFLWHHPFFQWAYSHQQHHGKPSQQCSRNLREWNIHFKTYMLLHRNNDKDSYLGNVWSRLSWISPETGFQWMSLPFLGEAFWGTENLGHCCGKFASPIWQNHLHLTFAWGNSEMPLRHYAIIMTFIQSNAAWTAYNNYRGCITYKHLPPTNEHSWAVLSACSNDIYI